MGKGSDRDAESAEQRSGLAVLLARAGRDSRQLARSLLLGEAVAERPRPIRPAPDPRHRK